MNNEDIVVSSPIPNRNNSASMVRIEKVVKWFGENEVLRGVNLEAARKQVTVILGPSGSGKSTLLRCVATLEEYNDGRILVDDELVGYREGSGSRKRLGDATLSRQRADIGMVFQSFNLFPQLTAMENVMLGLVHVRKVPKREAKERAFEWLSRVGLENRAQHYPYQLSGGQQQRVAIARAVAMQPKLLLLDEVTSALDPELVGEVLKVIKDLALSGITMLIVTHELLFAKEVAREIVFMDEGLVVERGVPSDVLSNPQTDRFKTFLKRYENVFMGTTS